MLEADETPANESATMGARPFSVPISYSLRINQQRFMAVQDR